MNDFDTGFTLQLFHFSDQEANTSSVTLAPNLSAVLAALAAEDIDGDGEAGYADTLILSSGDAWIPGLFYNASEEIYGLVGAADILIQNELGVQAIAFGNHEFDQGPGVIADLLSGIETPEGAAPFAGANFPYLSGNLDFSGDADLGPLVAPDGSAAETIPGQIAGSTVVTTAGGERIGVVGATTPTLAAIASPGGDIDIQPAGFSAMEDDDIAALAAVIQEDVDALLAANPDINKVIVLAHMQEIAVEFRLAELLEGVDIVMAGGSNTVLLDETDTPFPGDSAQGAYPSFFTGADGNPVAVVNTDKTYEYLGRLVIDFDDAGVIVPASYDPELSGAFETSDAAVTALGADDLRDPEIEAIVAGINDIIVASESNFFAVTDVFLNGRRSGTNDPENLDGVRTQETNLGNLTADANLAYARLIDETVVASIKNGGGIRADIGSVVVPGGGGEPERLPPEGVPGAKPEGGISQNDIGNALSFNNGLTLLTLTTEELVAVLEHGVAATTDQVAGQGRFPQVAGVEFSFDPDLPANDRILTANLVDADGAVLARLVEDGEIVDNGDATFRIVTLGFIADGGDGYPFPSGPAAERGDLDAVDSVTGAATFASDGTEQDALAEYLLAEFGTAEGAPAFQQADTPVSRDERIVNLDFQADTVGTLRVASYNASLNRGAEGELIDDLSTPDDTQAQDVAQVIQRTRPDVLLINEFDFDAGGEAARLFQENYLSVAQGEESPIEYPFVYVAPSNTGILTGFDKNNDGVIATEADIGTPAYANDSFGFGFFPGQFGFVIFSQHEIDEPNIRTFQEFLWADMPGALLFDTEMGRPLFDPERPFDPENPNDLDTSFFTEEEANAFRLSAKNHVDVPVIVDGETVHILAAHPTPPVFDGPEDLNGKLNHDEIRFWVDYVNGAEYITDDAGVAGGLDAGARFVIVGDYNADPFDGDSVAGAANQFTDSPIINGSATDPRVTPTGEGSFDQPLGANADHEGNPAFDTADFGFNASDPSRDNSPGNLRVDYALPSVSGLEYVDGRVVWPSNDDPFASVTNFPTSDHRLVYVDLGIEALGTTHSPDRVKARDAEFAGLVEIASGTEFEGTVLGGLSGLVYDPLGQTWFAVSDDRGTETSSPRVYELAIDLSDGTLDEGDVTILDVITLTDEAGETLNALNPDPEGIAILPSGNFLIASERDANGTPAVYEITREGVLVGELPVDDKFVPTFETEGGERTAGVLDNLGFESLTISPDGKTVTYATEGGLVQDGGRATLDTPAFARIVQADAATGEAIAEFVYAVDPIAVAPVPADAFADSGLTELIALDNTGTYLALERSFTLPEDATLDERGYTGKIYLVETQGATNVIGIDALPLEEDDGEIEALVDELAVKTLIADLGADFGIEPDNIESLAIGPRTSEDTIQLIVGSDDNFSAFGPQANQFVLLDIAIDTIPVIEADLETPSELRYPETAPLVIAHRGQSADRPEHTLEAYQLAIDNGADFIEPDLVTTSDGVLIARHEPFLATVELDENGEIVLDDAGNPIVTFETTNVADLPEFADRLTVKSLIPGFSAPVGGWFAEDFTLEEIKTLRAREDNPDLRPQSAEFDDQFEIPTLAEVIALAEAAGVGIYPETKEPSYLENFGTFLDGTPIGIDTSQLLVDTLVAEGFTDPDRVFIQSFEIENLLDLQQNIMPAAGVDLPLVQLISSGLAFPTVDIAYNFGLLEGVEGGDPSVYEPLGDLVTAETTFGDLVTPEGAATIADAYAEGVGPSLSTIISQPGLAEDDFSFVETSLVEDVQSAGLLVHAYTHADERNFQLSQLEGDQTTPEETYRIFLETGVDGLFTDNSDTGRAATETFVTEEGPDPDDPAIWINPDDPEASFVITSMKNDGLRVYDLEGDEVFRLDQPELSGIRYNNVDIVYDVLVGDLASETSDLVIASDRANDTLAAFAIDPASGALTDLGPLFTAPETIFGVDDGEATAYGLATYTSQADGTEYVFVTQADGNQIAQLSIAADGLGGLAAEVVRIIALPVEDGDDPADYQSEGIAVDRESGRVFVTGEGELGLIAFDAEPTVPLEIETIAPIDSEFFVPDLEGVAIHYGENGEGAIIVSSQGDATFAVFDRLTEEFVGSFAIGAGGVDGVQESDGLDIFPAPLGEAFPNGLLVTQDGSNEPQVVFGDPEDGEIQNFDANFKFTDLGKVIDTLGLAAGNAAFDPRDIEAVLRLLDETEAGLDSGAVRARTVEFDAATTETTLFTLENGFGFAATGAGAPSVTMQDAETIVFTDQIAVATDDDSALAIARFYEFALDRTYDIAGVTYWDGLIAAGTATLDAVADSFVDAMEFTETNPGDLDNGAFVDLLIANGLDGTFDGDDRDDIVARLDAGEIDRGDALAEVAGSPDALDAYQNLDDKI